MKLDIKIEETPNDYDSDNFTIYLKGSKVKRGSGYRDKENGKYHLIKCPQCLNENYAMQVLVGSCFKCGFDPNKVF